MKKKITILTSIFLLFTVFACNDFFAGKHDLNLHEIDIPDGYGAMQFSFVTGTARTAIPTETLAGLEFVFTLERYFENIGNGVFIGIDNLEPEEKEGGIYTYILAPGIYRLTVEVFSDEAGKLLVVSGQTEFIIEEGKTHKGDILLEPNKEESGTLLFTVHYDWSSQPGNDPRPSIYSITLSPLGETEKTSITEYDSIIFNNDNGEYEKVTENNFYLIIGNRCKIENIVPDFYIAEITLQRGDTFARKSEVVHIFANIETELTGVSCSFKASDFAPNYIVISTDDYIEPSIPGTLRYALEKANDGDTIRVMLPRGSVIELQAPLTINQSLTIEGNGVTVKPATDTQIKLMNITEGDVTIRRVHFTGGKSPDTNGGAIFNLGTLILESCIFSDNQSNNGSDKGSAIYNNETLTVGGCTFYNNKSETYSTGGAIHNGDEGTLNLKGNLFYQNSFVNEWRICVVTNNGTITSNGFNIVDLPSGTNLPGSEGQNECGWEFADTDRTFADLLILSEPFDTADFKPMDVSTLKIASGVLNFPDFYGNPRTNGVPGAVDATMSNYHIVTLNLNGGELWDLEGTIETFAINGYEFKGQPVPDERSLYEFLGWYYLSNGQEISVNGNSPLAIIKNETLTAKWEKKTIDYWDGSMDKDWYLENTSADEFTITSAAQLAGLADLVNAGTDFEGKEIKLGINISLENNIWPVIGCKINSNDYPFKGIFDGQGYVIENLYIDYTNASHKGLFGYIEDGEVKNLGLENVNINSPGDNIGGIAGEITNESKISNCYVTGGISGRMNVGGIAGKISDSNVKDCYSTANVTGNDTVNYEEDFTGGIVGVNHNSTVEYCYYYNGKITNSYITIGGIVGSGNANNCVAFNLIINNDHDSGAGLITGDGTADDCFSNGTFEEIENGKNGTADFEYEYLSSWTAMPNATPAGPGWSIYNSKEEATASVADDGSPWYWDGERPRLWFED